MSGAIQQHTAAIILLRASLAGLTDEVHILRSAPAQAADPALPARLSAVEALVETLGSAMEDSERRWQAEVERIDAALASIRTELSLPIPDELTAPIPKPALWKVRVAK